MNRRQFLRRVAGGAAAAAGVLAGLDLIGHRRLSFLFPDARRRGLLRPPGALAEEGFLQACIRCLRCSQVCAARAIRLHREGGRLQGTPLIAAEEHACDLCLECGRACPTGAILPLADKSQARMGLAVVDERLCVSHNGTGICGACFTVCPLRGKAITQGAHNKPTVHPESCVGCGLCEEACIVRDSRAGRAIWVHSPRSWS